MQCFKFLAQHKVKYVKRFLVWTLIILGEIKHFDQFGSVATESNIIFLKSLLKNLSQNNTAKKKLFYYNTHAQNGPLSNTNSVDGVFI